MNSSASTLNVLMVTPRYFPYVGGTETHVHEVGSRLARRGVRVTVLTTVTGSLADTLPREEIVEGMRIIRVRAWPAQRDYYIAPEIAALVRGGIWDLVHCQGSHTFVPPLAMLAAKRARLPYLVTFHTGGHSSRLRSALRSVQWLSLRPLLAGAAKLIAVSSFEAAYFRKVLRVPDEQVAVVPNGALDITALATPAPPPATTQSLIISVGRLERYKGHHRLIDALPLIRERRPDARLLILGSGPYESSLRKLALERGVAAQVEIRSIPADERQAMADLLAQAALVTLLSDYESQGIAIMEALALRRPVLVAKTSALSDLAEQRLARAVEPDSSASEIARAVLEQMEHPLLPQDYTLPTWEDCTDRLLDIYKSIAAKRSAIRPEGVFTTAQ